MENIYRDCKVDIHINHIIKDKYSITRFRTTTAITTNQNEKRMEKFKRTYQFH